MILKEEVLTTAKENDLLPTTIEKDYVIGWLLLKISTIKGFDGWMFKGGTCLKKCYFETYRFSEDLDFTLLPECDYSQNAIAKTLNDLTESVSDESGIQFPTELIKVEEYQNKRGEISFQCKVAYEGPLRLPQRSLQRIKFDLTKDEIITHPPAQRAINHPYSDAPAIQNNISCYSINEILAEKTRAMYERPSRARDLYDIIHISRNFQFMIHPQLARESLDKKYAYKGLPEPSVAMILATIDGDAVRSEWKNQLEHQLPVLPSADSFISELPDALIWWVDHMKLATVKPQIAPQDKFPVVSKPAFYHNVSRSGKSVGLGRKISGVPETASGYMNKISFAARNNLLAKITYREKQRIVEPYSLRRPSTGNLLLYVHELSRDSKRTNHIKAFKVNEIQNASVMKQSFTPRFAIEL
ncbi:MAG: nucleotidyl transferase AbiEii/AbiGii toxin family protein [Candidatus Electryonea clarkiae]|nr:nucleotidyl transferase AbiEii/AbiGii toxin family protein [Candidatus Electryonea clarkiae]MDP8289109.1 nucleotidyl transferase AbiEii/AbiGii toxin family protein [Candidatus Electryonea clarkiae]